MPVDLLGGMGVVEAVQHTIIDWVAFLNQVQYALLCMQALQPYADA